jgi:hypothetical protein
MFPFAKDSLSRFVFGSAGAVIVLWLLWLGMKNPLTESADRIYFLSAIAVGALAFFVHFEGRRAAVAAGVGLAGLGLMVWGLDTVEHQNLVNIFWLGFGRKVTTVALVLIPLAGFLLRPEATIPKWYRLGAYGALGLVASIGALSFVQTPTSLSQPEHSGYVFNELYATAAGHFPYTDFVPQYQSLFAYLFYPIILLAGAEDALGPMLVAFSLLSVATVGIGVLAGWLATGGLNRILAPLVILPLVFLTQGEDRIKWAGSISALHSAFPVRMLMPTLIGVLLALLPALGARKWDLSRHTLPFGALVGLSCFHQIDFGLAAAVAVGTLIVISEPAARLPRSLGTWLGSVVLGFAAMPLLHWLAEKPLTGSRIGWFVRQFGGGFGSEPMQIPGPVLIVLPLLVGCTVTCLGALRAQRQALIDGGWDAASVLSRLSVPPSGGRQPELLHVHRAALIGAYFGVFGIAGFPYYLNRSYASGQLQILLMPLGIALCASVQVIVASPAWQAQRRSLASVPLRFALAIPVASLLLLPSPAHEWARLTGGNAETQWPSAKTASIVAIGERWQRLGSYDAVGYWGNDGNYIEAITGLHNVTRFNSPLDGTMSPAAMAELCSGIADENLQTLILGDMAPNPNKVCKQPNVDWTFKRSLSGIVVATRQPVAVSQK